MGFTIFKSSASAHSLVKFALGRAPWYSVGNELAALLPQPDGPFVLRHVHDTASVARNVNESSEHRGGPWTTFTTDAAAVSNYSMGGSRMDREVRIAKPTARAGFYRLRVSLPDWWGG